MKINRFFFLVVVNIAIVYAIFINAIYEYSYPILFFMVGLIAVWGIFIKNVWVRRICIILSLGPYIFPIREFYSLTHILVNGANDFKGVFTTWILLMVIFVLTCYFLWTEFIGTPRKSGLKKFKLMAVFHLLVFNY